MATPTDRPAPEPAPEPKDDRVHTACPVAWCPVCLGVSATQPLHPEVIDHLLKAGTELLLAVQAVVDMRAREVAPETATGPTKLEKIDLG